MKDRIIEIEGVHTINLDKVLYVKKFNGGFSIHFGGKYNYIEIENKDFKAEDFVKLWKSYFNQ